MTVPAVSPARHPLAGARGSRGWRAWHGGPGVRLAVMLPLAGLAFTTWVEAARVREAELSAWLLGSRASSPGRGLVLFPSVDDGRTFVLNVTASCSVLSVLLAVAVAGFGLVRAPLHRRVIGVLSGCLVAVAANQVRICGIGLVREQWGVAASLVVHEWGGTLLTLVAAAGSIAVAVSVASAGQRRGHRGRRASTSTAPDRT